ncbi:MAG TPA: hypothetical protein EYP49_05865 [Anaerolineae bacterium]|nr:hypothetical protein [Anaerolineae bacterium]
MSSSLRKVTLALMLVVILGSFAAVGWAKLKDNWRSTKSDQGQYLALGLAIREGTALTDGNRHPLYPALLALFAEREWAYFTKAKMLTLAIALLGLVAIYWMGHRMFGQDVALLTALLLSVGYEFRRHSWMVMCEVLFIILFFAAWYFTVKGFSKGRCSADHRSLPLDLQSATSKNVVYRYWILAGVFAGLAQLTKGSGQLFAIAFLLSSLLLYGRRALTQKGVWTFIGCYLVVTSVLMAYNYREYGNPLYNFNTTHAMWLDDWEDSYVASPQELPTLTSYWQNHSPGDIVAREREGSGEAWLVLILALIPAHSWYMRDFLYSGTGLVTLLVGAVGLGYLFRERLSLYWKGNRERIVFSLVLFILFWVLITWYACVTPEPRLLLPLGPIFYVFLAEGLCGLGRWVGFRLAGVEGRLIPTAYAAFYIGLALWVLSLSGEATQKNPSANPFELDRLRNAYRDGILAWLSEEAQNGGTVMYGPSHSLPTWKYNDLFTFFPIPNRVTWAKLSTYMEGHAIKYALLDGETVSRRQSLFQGYFQALGEEKVDILALPGHWELIFASEEIPCQYCIFRVNGLGPDERWRVAVGCSFDQEVRLMGYSLQTDQVESGQVDLALYWQVLRPPATRYDVLLKIINTSYKVWGQQSEPLPGPFLPLEWVKPGQIIKDRREIELLPATPPGSYSIEVHVYSPSAERWLEPEEGCDILLGPVQVSRREPPAVEDLDLDHPIGAVLGGRVRLLGYNIESGFRPGDGIHLTLFWQCLAEMEQDYTVFTHLVDGEGRIWGQKDNPPVDGLYPTTEWEVGEIVRDQYDLVIPSEAPPGQYHLKVGMYLAETGERLRMVRGDEPLLENVVTLPPFQVHR